LLGSGINGARRCFSGLWRLEARFKGVQFEGKVRFVGRPLISVAGNSTLVLGDNVTVVSALRSNPLGCFQPSVLRTLEPGARLVLGSNSGMSGAVICAALSIEIGEDALIGSGAMIIDNDFHVDTPLGWDNAMRKTARPIKIGRMVFIGARAIILKGVTIGDRAVIGAGAVVTKDVPAAHLAAGNPASVFARRRQDGNT
jgi:carbonic anhydrase/acetyltransferase-like protein (isoleucine patch superfamily)